MNEDKNFYKWVQSQIAWYFNEEMVCRKCGIKSKLPIEHLKICLGWVKE